MRHLSISMSVLALMLVTSSGAAFATHSSLAAAEVVGVHHDGAQYALFRPFDWNGSLVVYAHGFVDPAAALALPDAAPVEVAPWVVELRERLLGAGYAVAYSSYSTNGWAVEDGALRTHELHGLFADHFRRPSRTYIVGRSLGALIALMLAERYPAKYAGALALCGPVGGGLLQTDYIANVRVLFDFFFPGVIPGNVVNVPSGLDYSPELVGSIVYSISTNWGNALALAAVDQIDLPYTSLSDLVTSIVRTLGYNIQGANDLLARTGGRSPFGNTTTTYTGSSNDAELNANVGRFYAAAAAVDYLTAFYRPTGNVKIPLVTLHTTLDPDVPFFHQAALESLVEAAGASNLLVQQHVARYGHCNFSPAEAAGAFGGLAKWVEAGVKPVPGQLSYEGQPGGQGGTTGSDPGNGGGSPPGKGK
jgi:pimeloyl-ACP methyl ester carboxylesterase